MEVDVVDDLAALGPGIAREAVSALAVAGTLGEQSRHADAVADDLLVSGLERRDRLDVSLGNDQQMDRRLGVEVLERHDLIVLEFDVGGAFPGGYTTEDAAFAHRRQGLVYTRSSGRMRPRRFIFGSDI